MRVEAEASSSPLESSWSWLVKKYHVGCFLVNWSIFNQSILSLLYSDCQNDTSYKIQTYKYPTLNITKRLGYWLTGKKWYSITFLICIFFIISMRENSLIYFWTFIYFVFKLSILSFTYFSVCLPFIFLIQRRIL